MMFETDSTQILIYTRPVDMRRAIDGLAVIVSERLDLCPSSGTIYVFYNRQGDKLKILYWQRNGFCVWYKRLEKDRFKLPKPSDKTMEISMQQLRWLLDGLDFTKLQRHGQESYKFYY